MKFAGPIGSSVLAAALPVSSVEQKQKSIGTTLSMVTGSTIVSVGRPERGGVKARGQGRSETDRPLVVVWVARDNSTMAIEMRRDAGTRTLNAAAIRHVAPGSRLHTDYLEYLQLAGLVTRSSRRQHSEAYLATAGTHCNTTEAEQSVCRAIIEAVRAGTRSLPETNNSPTDRACLVSSHYARNRAAARVKILVDSTNLATSTYSFGW